jgi:hypothetical protein
MCPRVHEIEHRAPDRHIVLRKLAGASDFVLDYQIAKTVYRPGHARTQTQGIQVLNRVFLGCKTCFHTLSNQAAERRYLSGHPVFHRLITASPTHVPSPTPLPSPTALMPHSCSISGPVPSPAHLSRLNSTTRSPQLLSSRLFLLSSRATFATDPLPLPFLACKLIYHIPRRTGRRLDAAPLQLARRVAVAALSAGNRGW